MDAMKQRFQENVTSMMWQSGKQKATKAWNVYGNIDFLRPYFNVEPHEVRSRLLYSFVPQRPTEQRQKVHRELYGPMMIIFTLIALLLFQMKTADHRVEEGTLMGTAFGVCFTYWFGASGLVWVLTYVCNTHLTLIQILSMMGYGLGSHCVVIFLGTIIHTSHDHLFFYALWAIVGGLSTLRMVSIILSRTHGQTQRMIVCGAVAALNLLFLLYLHFAYHQIVEDLSEVFHQNPVMMEKPVIIPTKGVNPPTVAAKMTHQAKKVIEPMADTVVKVVNKTVTAAVKQLANQKGPLLNALKDGVKLANAKPA